MLAAALSGCGLDQQSPDLFLLTRTGQGPKLTLLANDGGTIRCNGGKARALPDALLIAARDLAQDLDKDARHGLTIKPSPGTVFYYRIKLEHGTISFPDSAARSTPRAVAGHAVRRPGRAARLRPGRMSRT